MFSDDDRTFMQNAIDLAHRASSENEVPVGAVLVDGDKIVGKGYNKVIQSNDVSAHAEINAIRDASNKLGNYRLNGLKMYLTLEPCHMCAKAIVDARIGHLVFAAKEPKTGSLVSVDNFYNRVNLNHHVSYEHGLLEKESSEMLKNFFKDRRKN
jgi:tRNA(adenine34) deaminase